MAANIKAPTKNYTNARGRSDKIILAHALGMFLRIIVDI